MFRIIVQLQRKKNTMLWFKVDSIEILVPVSTISIRYMIWSHIKKNALNVFLFYELILM